MSHLRNSPVQTVVEPFHELCPDLFLRSPGSCRENSEGSCLRTLYALKVVVSDGCATLGFAQYLVNCVERQTDRRDAHCRSVAPTVVRTRLVSQQPIVERSTIAGVRVLLSEL